MIQLLSDSHIPYLDQLLPKGVVQIKYSGIYPTAEELKKADALIVRTVSKIDATVLDHAPNLKFIGTASAGFDHLDRKEIKKNGIWFGYSPGCNARAVAEYVVTGILIWADKNDQNINDLNLGIVGYGHAGSQVKNLAEACGLKTVIHDPPKAERESDFISASVEDVLACDILTFHCSLDEYAAHPSWHWLNGARLKQCSAKLIINAARGGVTDEKAVLDWKSKTGGLVITDVWENEPEFQIKTMQKSFIATPHIAGYSVESKWNATEQIMTQLADFFNLDNVSAKPESGTNWRITNPDGELSEILTEIHPIMEYDHRLRQLPEKSILERKYGFAKLRSGFPLRYEYPSAQIPETIISRHPILANLGLRAHE